EKLREEKEWRRAIDQLTQLQLVREALAGDGRQMALFIRQDSYFEKVVTDYPQPNRPHQGRHDLDQLKQVLTALKDIRALFNLAQTYIEHLWFESALAIVDEILALDPTYDIAWYLRGAVLIVLHQHEESLVAL